LCSVLIWAAYLLRADRSPQNTVPPLPPHDLDTWNRELERLLHQ